MARLGDDSVLARGGCGGLQSISSFSVRLAVGLAAVGLMIAVSVLIELQHGSLAAAYPVVAGVVAYLLLAPAVFFVPLGTARGAMRRSKHRELHEIATAFNAEYQEIKRGIQHRHIEASSEGGTPANVTDCMTRLEQLKELHKLADSFPVWPFDAHNLRRFIAIVLVPAVPVFFEVILRDLAARILGLL